MVELKVMGKYLVDKKLGYEVDNLEINPTHKSIL